MPEFTIVQARYRRHVTRQIESQGPAGVIVAFGILARQGDDRFGQAAQPVFVIDIELERLRRIEHVLREMRSELREVDFERGHPILLLSR